MKKAIISFILILNCLCTLTVYGQNRNLTVSGVVMDATLSEPLPGASIFIKTATGVGTSSDVDGQFTISAANGEVLVFQMIGMESQEYTVRGNVSDLIIELGEDTQMLEDVVITGLTAQRRVSIVGAITSVDVEQLQTPASSLNNMMGGRIAGVMTSMMSGEPGQNISNFWIRGIGTFGANSGALVLIDGLEGRLQDVDPDDVQSFQILKDASATAVYGVRGANGVVIVTTKRGQSGRLQITGRATMQVNQLRRLPKYLGAYDYAKLANEARAMSGESDLYTSQQLEVIKHGLDPDLYPDVNWLDEIIKPTSMQHRYYVSARGGSQYARYFVSLGTQFEESAWRQDNAKFGKSMNYNRVNYRANIDMDLTPTTALYFGTEGGITNHTRPGSEDTQAIWTAVRMITPLMMPVTYSDGTLPTYGTMDYISPYARLNYLGYRTDAENHNKLTLRLEQKINHGTFRGLSVSAQAMTEVWTFMFENRWMNPNFYRATGRDAQGELMKSLRIAENTVLYGRNSQHQRKYYGQAMAEWNRNLFGLHDLGALLFYYMEDFQDQRRTLDILGINNIPFRRQNVSGRLSYGYNNTYFVDANFGYTGSSQFKKGQRFGFFPSIALGWVPTGHQWMQDNISAISFMKIRGSYGLAGNDQISGDTRFPYLTLVNNMAPTFWPALFPYRGVTETLVGADNLKWEVSKKSNIGLEINFLNDRLRFVADIFQDRRENIFMQRVTIPGYLGLVTLPYSNVGRMRSSGSDGNIEYTHRISSDMEFTVRTNYTFAQNKIDYFEENELPYNYLSVTGKPYEVLRGFIAEGLFRDQNDIDTHADQSIFGHIRPGDIKYRDINGDGIINDDDRVPLSYGNLLPRLMYGVGGDFRWKNLTAGLLFRGAAKVNYFQTGVWVNDRVGYNSPGWIPFHSGELGNVLAMANNPANRWTPAWYSGDAATENPNAMFPRLSYGNNANNEQLSTFWQRNGSYLRLQEVSLRYKLRNMNWINTIGLSSVDLEFVVNNIFTIDQVKYFDPEQASANGSVYPIPRSYTFQLYLNF